jgi:hypothetical protein
MREIHLPGCTDRIKGVDVQVGQEMHTQPI